MQGVIPENIEDCLSDNTVFMFSKSSCPYCVKAKALLNSKGVKFTAVECDKNPLNASQRSQLTQLSNVTTYPNIFIGKKSIGGCDNLHKLEKSGELNKLLDAAGIAHN